MKGIETREMIVEESAKLFNKYGYHGCSMAHIMKATQLQKGGIYNHFGTKEEIALAAFEYSFTKILKRFRKRLDFDTSAVNKLISIVEVFQSFHHKPIAPGGCPIMNMAMDSTEEMPLLRQRAQEAIKTLHTYIEIKIQEGKDGGEIRPEVNPEQTASLMISSLEGALILSDVMGSEDPINQAASTMKKMIFQDLKQTENGAE